MKELLFCLLLYSGLLLASPGFVDPSILKLTSELTTSEVGNKSIQDENLPLILLTSSKYCSNLSYWTEAAFKEKTNSKTYHFGSLCIKAAKVNKNNLSKKLNVISQYPLQVWLGSSGKEELEIASKNLGLKTISNEPNAWWQDLQEPGSSVVLGILDSGIAIEHPMFNKKKVIKIGEQLNGKFVNDVRTAHGTGVAAIAVGLDQDSKYNGIAYNVETVISAFAGDKNSEGDEIDGINLTLQNLYTMLNQDIKVDVINYSFGNGNAGCKNYSNKNCNFLYTVNDDFMTVDWSPVARIVDAVVESHKILWIKSAGNYGWVAKGNNPPFPNTITSPADNYNGITVANMDSTDYLSLESGENNLIINTPNRLLPHIIRSSSSRGPTLLGRRKPDLTAPGHNVRTAAPDLDIYRVDNNPQFNKKYNSYDGKTRLMTGTSSAAPFVTGAVLLLKDYANKNPKANILLEPIAIKALLINSADSWTDNNQPGTHDIMFICSLPYNNCGHKPINYSEWNATYGFGYINLERAFKQRNNVVIGEINPLQQNNAEIMRIYKTHLKRGEKVTLTWLRHTGFEITEEEELKEYPLNHLKLSIFNPKTGELFSDPSNIDNVLQVSNGNGKDEENAEEIYVIVWTKDKKFAVVDKETYALASAGGLAQIEPDFFNLLYRNPILKFL